MLTAGNAYSASLAGQWKCRMADDSAIKTLVVSTLTIDSNLKTYERNAEITFRMERVKKPIVQIDTHERGLLSLREERLTFSPVDARVTVVQSGILDEALLARDSLASLQTEASAHIVKLDRTSFTIKLDHADSFDECVRVTDVDL